MSTFNCWATARIIVVRNSAVVGVTPITNCNDMDPRLAFENGASKRSATPRAVTHRDGAGSTRRSRTSTRRRTAWNVDPLEDDGDLGARAILLSDFTGDAAIPTDEPSFAGARQPL